MINNDYQDQSQNLDDKETYYRVAESNYWEGETWYHYFLDEPGVLEALKSVKERVQTDFEEIKKVTLSDESATVLANIDEGYMCPHWFGILDIEKLSTASEKDLYKGGIRNYAEDMFESVVIATDSDS